jgi:hypothetical protein
VDDATDVEIEIVPDQKQNAANEPQDSKSQKKTWETPKLAMLDINVNTLGGTTSDVIEGIKTFPS